MKESYTKSRAELNEIAEKMIEYSYFDAQGLLDELMSAMDTDELEADLRWISDTHDLDMFEEDEEEDEEEEDEDYEEDSYHSYDRGVPCSECLESFPAEVMNRFRNEDGSLRYVCPDCTEDEMNYRDYPQREW